MYLSLLEAARRVGVAKSTVFRRVKSGEIPATRNQGGEWQIAESDLLEHFEPVKNRTSDAHRSDADDHTTPVDSTTAQWFRELVDELRDENQALRDQERVMRQQLTAIQQDHKRELLALQHDGADDDRRWREQMREQIEQLQRGRDAEQQAVVDRLERERQAADEQLKKLHDQVAELSKPRRWFWSR